MRTAHLGETVRGAQVDNARRVRPHAVDDGAHGGLLRGRHHVERDEEEDGEVTRLQRRAQRVRVEAEEAAVP